MAFGKRTSQVPDAGSTAAFHNGPFGERLQSKARTELEFWLPIKVLF